MNLIQTPYATLRKKVDELAHSVNRSSDEIKILPVSKGHSVEILKLALTEKTFPHSLGENYLEELQTKVEGLSLEARVEWHFLGRLQSRKIETLASLVSVLHTVSREKELKILAELQNQRKALPKFFVQVNISNEDQKNGCSGVDLPALLEGIKKWELDSFFLGLMGMAAPLELVGSELVREQFKSLRHLRDALCPGRGLNMGMSSDFEIAIEEGANLVRLGTAIFGEREANH